MVQKQRGSARARRKLPRPAPPNQKIVWEKEVPKWGRLFCHGSVVRDGRPSYLIRKAKNGVENPVTAAVTWTENSIAVVLLETDGKVMRWYYDFQESADQPLREAIEEAGDFVLMHSVMTG